MAQPVEIRSVKAVLVDLDGTMLDTVLDLHAAANGMMRELGREEVSIETVRGYVGRGVPNLVKRLLAGKLEAADDPAPPPTVALEVFQKHYHESNGRYAAIYPGVVEGLTQMAAKGLKLACITNKAETFTTPLLERTGLRRHFQAVIAGDALPRQKPDPMQLIWICGRFDLKPHEVLLVGDSKNDAKAARAAGCPTFIVPYGYNEGEDVRKLDCDAIVNSLAEAAELVQRA